MDFLWSKEQEARYHYILHESQKRFDRCVLRVDDPWNAAHWQACSELGLLGLCAPTQYGGEGLDALTTAHSLEAFGRGCANMGLVFSVAAHLFACIMPIAEFGTPDLKERFLPSFSLVSGFPISRLKSKQSVHI